MPPILTAVTVQVTLTIQPHSSAKGASANTVILARQRITAETVTRRLCEPLSRTAPILAAKGKKGAESSGPDSLRLGYIRVANFSKTTTDSVREALKGLKKEGADR